MEILLLQIFVHLLSVIGGVCQIILTLRKYSQRHPLFQKSLQITVVSLSVISTTVYVIVLVFSDLQDAARIFILTFTVLSGTLQITILLLVIHWHFVYPRWWFLYILRLFARRI